MDTARARRYDRFKLAVTVVLVLILLFMLLRGCASLPASTLPAENTAVPAPAQGSASPVPSQIVAAAEMVTTETPSPAPSATPTLAAATATPTSSAETATETPEATQAAAPTATETALAASTPTTVSAASSSCNTVVPSRLSVGQTARVVQRLNMRGDASVTAPILQTNAVGTQVEIIGGPVCTPVGESAYLWWQIRRADGVEGWSAEAPLNERTFFLEPSD
jgi:hypothetical protein